jgi:hypothetical protein
MQPLRLVILLGSLSVLGLTPQSSQACPYCPGGGMGVYGPGYYASPGAYAPPWYYPAAPVAYPPWAYYPYYPLAYRPYPLPYSPYFPVAYAPPAYYPAPPYTAMYPPARPIAEVSVGLSDDYFSPQTLNVQPGTVVRWLNNGNHVHTVTSKDGKWDSGDIPPGQSFAATLQYPGIYHVYCRHHKGMEATIVVAPAVARPPGQ